MRILISYMSSDRNDKACTTPVYFGTLLIGLEQPHCERELRGSRCHPEFRHGAFFPPVSKVGGFQLKWNDTVKRCVDGHIAIISATFM